MKYRCLEPYPARWMEADTGEAYEGDIGCLVPEDSRQAAKHDGGAGIVVTPEGKRIYWED